MKPALNYPSISNNASMRSLELDTARPLAPKSARLSARISSTVFTIGQPLNANNMLLEANPTQLVMPLKKLSAELEFINEELLPEHDSRPTTPEPLPRLYQAAFDNAPEVVHEELLPDVEADMMSEIERMNHFNLCNPEPRFIHVATPRKPYSPSAKSRFKCLTPVTLRTDTAVRKSSVNTPFPKTFRSFSITNQQPTDCTMRKRRWHTKPDSCSSSDESVVDAYQSIAASSSYMAEIPQSTTSTPRSRTSSFSDVTSQFMESEMRLP